MEEKDFELLYKRMLEDEDFQNLELELKKPNIFEALSIQNYEIRHSNFLAWLLDPKGTHGLDKLFLERFLRELFIDSRSEGVSVIDLPELNIEDVIIRREWKHIDILIELKDIVISIENKVFSKEHSNQLKRYNEIVNRHYPEKKKIFVYLTPFGESASLDYVYINISYSTVINIIEGISRLLKDFINVSVQTYLNDYVTSVKRNIMGTSEINKLAARVYKNHKEILDEVYNNMPDDSFQFKEILEKGIKAKGWITTSPNKGFVRFLTNDLSKCIPKGFANGWPDKEAFLFEITFLYSGKNQTRIYATIDGSDHEAASILKPILDEIEGKENKSSRWFCYQNKYRKVDIAEIMTKDNDEIDKIISGIIDEAESIVKIVEPKILEKKDELLKLINSRKKE